MFINFEEVCFLFIYRDVYWSSDEMYCRVECWDIDNLRVIEFCGILKYVNNNRKICVFKLVKEDRFLWILV